jgi:hypothetical protein
VFKDLGPVKDMIKGLLCSPPIFASQLAAAQRSL